MTPTGDMNTQGTTGTMYTSTFTVASEKSAGGTSTYSFSAIMLKLGLNALKESQETFRSQFDRAQELVDCMEELNKIMQVANNLKAKFSDDAKGDATQKYDTNNNLKTIIGTFNAKYPNEKISGTFGTDNISKANLEAVISNMQTVQSTLASKNEQQSMRTNQAMNRASGYLQQLQSLLQTAKEGIQVAAKAGGS